MVFMKYVLGQTGFFPQWEPKVDDVLLAATLAHDVDRQKVRNFVYRRRGRMYYYVIPNTHNVRYLNDLLRVFRANGVILRPHKSRTYREVVFRVPDRGQDFMVDVMRVNHDVDKFQKVLSEHDVQMSRADVLNKVVQIKQKYR